MFQFTKDCMIGIEQIDDEHRHLFALLNQGMNMLAYHGSGDSYDEIKNLMLSYKAGSVQKQFHPFP